MGVAKSVFASRAERANFQKLQSLWGDRYNLWHNLPFLNLFRREGLIDPDSADLGSLSISDIEWQRLNKTSVDYVLCDRAHGAPLICIDFDGIPGGFNAGREYRPRAENPAPWRDVITSLKLKVAHGSLFPYIVVGWREFADISPTIRRSIVDGIIGEILAKQAVSDRFARGLTEADTGMTEAEWDALPPWDRREIMEDVAMTMEINADFEHKTRFVDIARVRSELTDLEDTSRGAAERENGLRSPMDQSSIFDGS